MTIPKHLTLSTIFTSAGVHYLSGEDKELVLWFARGIIMILITPFIAISTTLVQYEHLRQPIIIIFR